MREFEGSHGTSRSRAYKIQKVGFTGSTGRGGSGIYFWCHGRYNTMLAIGWDKFQCKKKVFVQDKDPLVAVIIAKLEDEDYKVLDMENIKFKERIDQLADDMDIDKNKDADIAAIYDLFIEDLELKSNSRFSILLLKVAPPPINYCPEYSIKILGAPLCCVVRDQACIKILRITEGEDENSE